MMTVSVMWRPLTHDTFVRFSKENILMTIPSVFLGLIVKKTPAKHTHKYLHSKVAQSYSFILLLLLLWVT